MQISKAGDSVTFRYSFEHRQIRRVVSVAELTEFLEGGRREESNLPDGRLPVVFKEFATEKYLHRCAKPNLKSNSYAREEDSAKALIHVFAETLLHKIDLDAWENYKTGRLNGTLPFSKTRCANSTVDKEFDCLRRILNYGVQLGLIKRNPLLGTKGLKNESRREIWLTKAEIERLLGCADPWLRDLIEFRVLTGARPTEANMFGTANVDLRRGEIWVHTLKKRTNLVVKRYFEIASLGPRFEALLQRLKPHPVTGMYFFNRMGKPYAIDSIDRAFVKVRRRAKLDHVTPYDLRGTFAMHRAMVVKNFRQLQTEMGHSNPMSIQSYLDEASRYRIEDSIFADAADAASLDTADATKEVGQ
ncbi:MAG: tyrosine-type recombinase/integrase [Elusimicrobia bacterium]|nr:tyrosine-type recombinase/integrase [Elusimicrobiota bacterium]